MPAVCANKLFCWIVLRTSEGLKRAGGCCFTGVGVKDNSQFHQNLRG